ncbi:MAG: hypothetical protein H8E44_06420 [Planctomycetes bacterium]|nr:hypothetical protein [Planctomycetota bacterium]MBL7039355.1 hypothetical protein [Pirellulaceae bacterium]
MANNSLTKPRSPSCLSCGSEKVRKKTPVVSWVFYVFAALVVAMCLTDRSQMSSPVHYRHDPVGYFVTAGLVFATWLGLGRAFEHIKWKRRKMVCLKAPG